MRQGPQSKTVPRYCVAVDGLRLEVATAGAAEGAPVIAAAHPAEPLQGSAASLLATAMQTQVVCVNPSGVGGSTTGSEISLERAVDEIEAVRRHLGLAPWVFWGMSGGGWLAQLYALRHPTALAGIVIESACLCFRERLADPNCILSPWHPQWAPVLRDHGLLAEHGREAAARAGETEWSVVAGVGEVFRRRAGPALLVASTPQSESMKRAMPAMWAFDSRPWIRGLRVPTLVIAGTADPVAPLWHVAAVHDAIRGSEFLAVEGAAHVPTALGRSECATAYRRFAQRLTAWRVD